MSPGCFAKYLELKKNSLIDHESFLAFGVALTFFTLGVVGILGSDDILCCFVVGNSFTWDDWFRVQSEDHSFQDVIDQLLNSVSSTCVMLELTFFRITDSVRPSSCISVQYYLGHTLTTIMG